jgi:hypothetical protein
MPGLQYARAACATLGSAISTWVYSQKRCVVLVNSCLQQGFAFAVTCRECWWSWCELLCVRTGRTKHLLCCVLRWHRDVALHAYLAV